MDADFFLIIIMIITTTAISFIGVNAILAKLLDYKRDKAGIPRAGEPARQIDSNLADRTDLIEDRLRVLERLATDKGTLLSDEIEALRLDVATRHEKENG